jgi:hypothetical protein
MAKKVQSKATWPSSIWQARAGALYSLSGLLTKLGVHGVFISPFDIANYVNKACPRDY